MNWDIAKEQLKDHLGNCKLMVGMENCVMGPYLLEVGNLITRFNMGERTSELYEAIMALH